MSEAVPEELLDLLKAGTKVAVIPAVQLAFILTRAHLGLSAARALLHHIDPERFAVDDIEIEALRGTARLGLQTPPEEDDSIEMQALIMDVLDVLGLEPLPDAEVDRHMRTAMMRMMAGNIETTPS